MTGVPGLNRPLTLDLQRWGEVVDLCLDQRPTWFRKHAATGRQLTLTCAGGAAQAEVLGLWPVLDVSPSSRPRR